MNYEYKVVVLDDCGRFRRDETLKYTHTEPTDYAPRGNTYAEYEWGSINELGADGWELVSVQTNESDGYIGWFKRVTLAATADNAHDEAALWSRYHEIEERLSDISSSDRPDWIKEVGELRSEAKRIEKIIMPSSDDDTADELNTPQSGEMIYQGYGNADAVYDTMKRYESQLKALPECVETREQWLERSRSLQPVLRADGGFGRYEIADHGTITLKQYVMLPDSFRRQIEISYEGKFIAAVHDEYENVDYSVLYTDGNFDHFPYSTPMDWKASEFSHWTVSPIGFELFRQNFSKLLRDSAT